jgi:hypothetical protein
MCTENCPFDLVKESRTVGHDVACCHCALQVVACSERAEDQLTTAVSNRGIAESGGVPSRDR